MSHPAENFARRIVERLQAAGHTAYFAGGCVRDRLMGRAPKDFDVATSARPEQVLALFPRGQQVGAAFGVILLVEGRGPARLQVEVATFRADASYSDGRHPDSVRFTTAREDAQRRDFTCNGLFFDPVAGTLHDFVGGQADIQSKILRAIGDPAARFAEDHLRMLRAVRFAAKLGFTIEAATGAAIQHLAENIRTVSRERVHDELAAILSHPTRAVAAEVLEWTGLLKQIWPRELVAVSATDPRPVGVGLCLLAPASDFVTALVPLYMSLAQGGDFHRTTAQAFSGSAVAEVLRREFMLSNVESADLAWLLDKSRALVGWEQAPKSALKRLLADARWPRLENLFVNLSLDPSQRASFDARIAQLRIEGVAPEPFVSGDTLIALGASPGPKFKAWLETLYDRQLEGEIKTPGEAHAAARALIAS